MGWEVPTGFEQACLLNGVKIWITSCRRGWNYKSRIHQREWILQVVKLLAYISDKDLFGEFYRSFTS